MGISGSRGRMERNGAGTTLESCVLRNDYRHRGNRADRGRVFGAAGLDIESSDKVQILTYVMQIGLAAVLKSRGSIHRKS